MGLTLERIESILAGEKENWQRKVNQGALKQSLGAGPMALNEQLQALGAMEALEQLRHIFRSEDAREPERPKRAREIRLPGQKLHIVKREKP